MAETIRVLCVDDEKYILNVIRRQLDDDHFKLFQALTVEDALELLHTSQPIQVVLTDYRMPGSNGIDFLQNIAVKWPCTAGIIISGCADTRTVEQALSLNPLIRFIAKPWSMEELRQAVLDAATAAASMLAEKGTP